MNCSARVTTSGTAALSAADAAEAFRAVAELAVDAVFVIDCSRCAPLYLSASLPALLGHPAGAVTAALAEGAGPLAPLMAGLALRRARLAAGDATRLQLRREHALRRADGGLAELEVRSVLLQDGALLAGSVRDLAPQRALAAEQRRFAGMLNHEFRTPLATIDGAVQRLQAQADRVDAATAQRYQRIGAAVERLIGMLDTYLSPDRVADSGTAPRASTAAPRQLLEAAAARLAAAGRPVQLAADGLPASVRADPAGLQVVLDVLVDNVLTHTPAGTPVALDGKPAAGGIELLVRDGGPGVAAADAAHIFDKGYRGAGAPGSGLGLYIARSVVEVHGGTLDLLAGPGAALRIWLPVAAGRFSLGPDNNNETAS